MSAVERLHPLDALDLAQAACALVLAQVRNEDWDRPTQCDLWSVRDVSNKIVASTRMFTAFGLRKPLDPSLDLIVPVEMLGDDHLGTYLDAAARCREAWRREQALEGTAPSTVGEFPAKAVLNARIFDTTILTCDLAVACGVSHGINDSLAAYVLRVARALVANVRAVSPERYKDDVEVGESAPLVDQMVAATGRNPRWSRPSRS